VAFPALFVCHGAPTAAPEDDACTRALGAWARGRPRPHAVVTPELLLSVGRALAPLREKGYGTLSLRSFALAAP
jgi:hypothetical protein